LRGCSAFSAPLTSVMTGPVAGVDGGGAEKAEQPRKTGWWSRRFAGG